MFLLYSQAAGETHNCVYNTTMAYQQLVMCVFLFGFRMEKNMLAIYRYSCFFLFFAS